ncbi:hypothetical protein QBC43DRAFT_324271 [Cladorrhinum sp. PSN259]|nr:hypothetical protein QBC43DRAFT_324271 [Cladorrhinum sp. PSN259]
MSIIKGEVPTASDPDCFIILVTQKTVPRSTGTSSVLEDATNIPASTVTASTATVTASAAPAFRVPSTPSRRSRLYQSHIDAQVASPSRAQAPSPSSRATPPVPQFEIPRKRERSRSPAGSPPSTSKRNRRASRSATASSGSPTRNYYHDARSNLGEGDEGERSEDRLVFSPDAASPPAGSAASFRTANLYSSPIPCRLTNSFTSTQRNRSLSSSSSSSPSPFPGPSRDVFTAGINPAGVKTEAEDSGVSFDSTISSCSSSQTSRSKVRKITNKDWDFSIDLQGSFTNIFDHWSVDIPAVLPNRGPKCKSCSNLSRLGITGQNNKRGNAGRPFYKCGPCDNWITWGDLKGCDRGNDECKCQKLSRTIVCGPESRCPGKRFWKCASGNCTWQDWESDPEWQARRDAEEEEEEEEEGSEDLFVGKGPEYGDDDYYPEDSY